MRGVYILCGFMLIGAMLMFACLYKLMNEMDMQKQLGSGTKGAVLKAEMQPYVLGGYLGLSCFVVGALGAIIMLVRAFNRRF